MAQFDVFANPIAAARTKHPYVVVLQSDLLAQGETAIVAPLARKGDPQTSAKLQQAVLVKGEPLVLLYLALTTVRIKSLGAPVARLPEVRDQMMGALDLIFLGF